MENENPTAQGQQAGAESQGPSQNDQFQGIQKRIDELTAARHQSEARVQQLMETNAQLLATLAQRQEQMTQPVQEQLDPSNPEHLPLIIKRATEEAVAPFKKQLQEQQARTLQMGVQSEMQQVQAELQRLNNPAVSQKVAELVAGWRAQGILGTTATPNDALNIAVGEAYRQTLMQQAQAGAARGQFNAMGGGSMMQQGSSGNAGRAPAVGSSVAADTDLNDMSTDQLQKLLADLDSKVGNERL